MSNPFRRAVAGLAMTGLAAGGAIAVATPAQSLPDPANRDCPAAYPIESLTKGQPVDGLTVSSGKLPDTFTGEVLGVLDDGIAPGVDMILVRLANPEIDRVGGIWAGMSGSPVYAADGRLIGGVAYGLAYGASPVAGLAPAADMQALLNQSPSAARAGRTVTLGKAMQARLVESGAATAREASSGLRRLPLPLAVSGTYNDQRVAKLAGLLDLGDVKVYASGAVSAAPVAAADANIFAGSNLAASMAYGDFSAVALGTTTMVCNGKPVGFGHPMNFSGDASYTLHGADAIYVQEDSLGAPFKVANPTGPVGVIDQDRIAGIKGLLGAAPRTTLVRTKATFNGKVRIGETRVSVPEFLPEATAMASLGGFDRSFDHIGKGSSLVTFVVKGSTPTGGPFTVTRTNRFADAGDISVSSMNEAASAVAALVYNEITDATIDSVDVTADLSTKARAFKVGKVQVQVRKGVWKTLKGSSVIKARAGKKLRFRVELVSVRGKFGTKTLTTSVMVPKRTFPGSGGSLVLGQGFAGMEEYEGEGGPGFFAEEPASFAELLSSIVSAPRNDELTTQLDLYSEMSPRPLSATQKKLIDDVILNQKGWEVRVVR